MRSSATSRALVEAVLEAGAASALEPQVIHRRGNSYLSKAAQANTRLPFGHPEAFIEALANVYFASAEAIADEVSGRTPKASYDCPTIDDGVVGMAFIETVVKSSKAKAKWTKFPTI